MYIPDTPIPSRMFSIGPPKHALSAMTGYPSLATVMSATKSPQEFAHGEDSEAENCIADVENDTECFEHANNFIGDG